MRLQEFPRHPLTFGPSPVHPLERLTAHLGGAAVWAKREDVSSGLAYGGNKTRKLEYIVPDALAKGADTLVSIGGYQSNHTRQVAAVAAHLGLKARLVQEKWVPWDDPANDRVGNILLSRIHRALPGAHQYHSPTPTPTNPTILTNIPLPPDARDPHARRPKHYSHIIIIIT